MPFNRFPLVVFVLAVADYLFKAAVNYRLTDEGAAEWSDVEAAAKDLTGDEDGAEAERAEASAQRASARSRQNARAVRSTSQSAQEVRRPLTED